MASFKTYALKAFRGLCTAGALVFTLCGGVALGSGLYQVTKAKMDEADVKDLTALMQNEINKCFEDKLNLLNSCHNHRAMAAFVVLDYERSLDPRGRMLAGQFNLAAGAVLSLAGLGFGLGRKVGLKKAEPSKPEIN